MSFKILAIRPLEETSPDLLKGLKINHVYKFYSEYSFRNDQDKDVNEDQNIGINLPLSEAYKEKEEKANQIICRVHYKEEVPTDFYPNDITISAIVGKNGSGKSSLLELYYFAVLILSNKNEIIELDKEGIASYLQCELYIEVIEKNKGVNQRIIKQIRIKSSNIKDKAHIVVSRKAIIPNKSDTSVEFQKESDEVDLMIFNNVLNYSLYGLNSNVMPWVEDLFWKNDAYQTPITINPFRDMGNIDINKEYLLAQARIILYVYLLKQNVFLDNIYLHEFNVKLDFFKYQYVEKDKQVKENLTTERIKVFLNQFGKNKLNQHFEYLVRSILSITQGDVKHDNAIFINKLGEIFEKYKNQFIDNNSFDINTEKSNVSVLNYLCFLYIFKKLRKITQVYKPYSKYRFIFNNPEWKSIVTFSTSIYQNELRSDKTKEVFLKTREEVISQFLVFLEKGETNQIESHKKLITLYLDKLTLLSSGNELFYDSYGQEVIDLFKSFILDSFEDIIEPALRPYYNLFINLFDIGVYSDYTLFNSVHDFLNNVDQLFVEQRDTKFIQFALEKYIQELKQDNSHITFKLKQAINYFKIGLFDKIEFDKEKLNQKEVELQIPTEFFQSKNGIENIPIAFFDFNMNVVKTNIKQEDIRNELVQKGELKAYPFNQLSSGEQQSIHTILTVVYHTYNLLSVSGSDKRKYRKIALVFDELELYLHPEYQRTFVNNLLSVLAIFKNQEFDLFDKELMFSILLSTHSPFILSDIPSQNVLKLKEGVSQESDVINSFGSNIHDLLADEFFLDDGFMGEYASEKINKLFDFISKLEDDELTIKEYNRLSNEINLIGEMVLREPLVKLLDKKMAKSPANKEFLIQKYQSILSELQQD